MQRRQLIVTMAAVGLVPLGTVVRAQGTDSATRARLGTLLTAAAGTPGGKSLVAVALAEAHVALAQAGAAETAATDLAAMQRSASGILHALDPALSATGPGAGYGVRRALTEIVAHIEATAAADRKVDVVRTTPRAVAAAQAAQQATEALVQVAQQMRVATTVDQAVPLARQARELAQRVIAGPNGSPERATLGPGVGGLLTVQSSLLVLHVSREGVIPVPLRNTRPASPEVPR